ncbi:MAG TPA: thioredoxin family protein [Puia sp.]|jgi:thioredoxin-related protein
MRQIPILLVLITLLACHTGARPGKGSKEKQLPDIILKLNNGNDSLSVAHLAPGRSTVLFYISPDCEYCQDEIKRVLKNIDFFKDVRIILITAAPLNELNAFCASYHIDRYQNISAGFDFKYAFQSKYKVKTIPYALVFDDRNELTLTFPGETDIELLKAAILTN